MCGGGGGQNNDPNMIGEVIRRIEYPYEPTTRELQLSITETRALWLTKDQLNFQSGVLCTIPGRTLEADPIA